MLQTRLLPVSLIVAAALGLVLPTPSAWAQKASESVESVTSDTVVQREGVADDEVVLALEVEDWVETKTATVHVAADLAVESGRFGAARQELVSTLQGFGAGAEWRIVDFGKLGDDAGFERWRLVAEARVSEATLADLAGKTKDATKPGRALSVASIDYSPTVAEREAVVDRLRARVYGRVAREIVALNSAFGNRTFRIRMIDFTTGFRPEPRMMTMARADAAYKEGGSAPAGGLVGAEKARLSARVVLAASATGG